MTNYRPSNIQERTFAFAIRVVKLVDCLPRVQSAVGISKLHSAFRFPPSAFVIRHSCTF
jgi:hypothetical protein